MCDFTFERIPLCRIARVYVACYYENPMVPARELHRDLRAVVYVEDVAGYALLVVDGYTSCLVDRSCVCVCYNSLLF